MRYPQYTDKGEKSKVRVITWKKTDPKVTTVTLVSQNDQELSYLNKLIREGKAIGSPRDKLLC